MRIKSLFILLFCLLGILGSIPLLAQSDRLRFEHLNLERGLSHSRVICALQDREGFMWFGTRYGLNKYDGYTFTVFQSDPNNPTNSLQHNYVKSIHEDKSGRLWVTTQGGGLHEVNKRTGKITFYAIPPPRNNDWNALNSLYEDRNGIFWFGTEPGILQFNPRTKKFIQYKKNGPIQVLGEDASGQLWAKSSNTLYQFDRHTGRFSPLPLHFPTTDPPAITAIYQDKLGYLWIGTFGKGLFKLNTKAHPMQLTAYNPDKLIKQTINAKGIYQDRKGYLWLATTEGLQRIDTNSNQVITYTSNPDRPGSLSSNDVLCVYEDRTGTFWVGNDNGINKADAHPKPFHAFQIQESSIRNIRALLEDSAGTVWFGSWREGLYSWDPKSKQIKHIPAKQKIPYSLPSTGVGAIYEDRSGRIWMSTREGLHLLDRATGKYTHYPAKIPILNITEDLSGKLWVAGRVDIGIKGAVASFDPVSKQYNYYYPTKESRGLNSYNVFNIMTSRSGEIWISTFRGGINRLNPKTGKFKYYKPDYPFTAGHLNDYDVRTLYEDAQGIIWVGTNQSGLNRFDPQTETFTYFTTREGLASNQVLKITGDKQGNLWISTTKGISRFNLKTQTFRNFDKRDGLFVQEYGEGSVYNRNGKLFFSIANGFVAFQPDSIKDNTIVPPVYITGFKVQEKSRPVPTQKMELRYYENFLYFDFVALNYASPEKNRYAYQLVGLDQDLIYSGTRHYANYTNLAPGEYIFRVYGSNNDGIWNKQGAAIHFIIRPPWWRTWWFLLGLCGLFIALIAWVVRYLTGQKLRERLQALETEHKVQKERERIARDLHDNVGSQLAYIINSLDDTVKQNQSLSNGRVTHLKDFTKNTISQLRETIWAIRQEKISIHELAARVEKLIWQFTQYRQDNFKYDISTTGDTGLQLSPVQALNLYRILQEAINNALKHSQATQLRISFDIKPAYYLNIIIQDNGIGFNTSDTLPQDHYGLANMKQRAKELPADLTIITNPRQGTSIYLKADLQKHVITHS